MKRAIVLLALALSACHRAPPHAPGNAYAQPRASFVSSSPFPQWAPPPLWLPVPIPWTLPLPASGTPGARAVSYAEAQRGKPYCWGGTGPHCFDCSGLTSMAWRDAGRPIPRTSEAQRNRLPAVPMWDLRPGDVLWRPGHVGIYVGNGRALHAPGTGKTIRYQAANAFREAHRPGL